MCTKAIAKAIKSWYSVVVGLIMLAISVTLWAQSEHDDVVVECQDRIDRACEEVKFRFAPIEDVRYNSKVLESINRKLDRLLEQHPG